MNIIMKILFPLLHRSRLCHTKVNRAREISIVISNSYHSNYYTLFYCKNLSTSPSSKMDGLNSGNGNKITFQGKSDRFNGVTIYSEVENCGDVNEFTKKLKDSLELWKESGKRGIWFRVHLDQADWVPVLAKNGFKFHHGKEEHVMMYLWLPTKETCNIPQYAHTMIGVGAVVVNEKGQVLVVSEKHKIMDRPFWKLPGGYVEPGENMVDAAIREVFEETGISTEFQSVLTFRHTHGGMFDCSDIYTVVSLKPLSEKIVKCEREIEECKWMDIDQYMTHPHVHELNRFFVQKYEDYNKHNIKVGCYHGLHSVVNRTYTLYSVSKKIDSGPANNGDEKKDDS